MFHSKSKRLLTIISKFLEHCKFNIQFEEILEENTWNILSHDLDSRASLIFTYKFMKGTKASFQIAWVACIALCHTIITSLMLNKVIMQLIAVEPLSKRTVVSVAGLGITAGRTAIFNKEKRCWHETWLRRRVLMREYYLPIERYSVTLPIELYSVTAIIQKCNF